MPEKHTQSSIYIEAIVKALPNAAPRGSFDGGPEAPIFDLNDVQCALLTVQAYVMAASDRSSPTELNGGSPRVYRDAV